MQFINNFLTRLMFFLILFLSVEIYSEKNNLHLILAAMFFIYSLIFFRKISFFVDIIRPSTICFYYVIIFMIIGGYNVELLNTPLGEDFYYDYNNIINYSIINFVIFSFLYINGEVCCLSLKNKYNIEELDKNKQKNKEIISFLYLIVFSIAAFNISLIKFPILVGLMIIILCNMQSGNEKINILILFFVIIISVTTMYHNKREVISIIILIIFYVLYTKKVKFNIVPFFYNLLLLLFIFNMILLMSILRLDDEFSLLLIANYLNSDSFKTLMIDNFEISHFYLSTYLSIDYIINLKIQMLPLNLLFDIITIPVPRIIWEDKPLSLMLEFTKLQSPWKYENGGSFPVNVFIEFLSSFYYLYPFFLFLFLYFSDLICVSNLKLRIGFKSALSFSLLVYSFMLVRGSGFDLFVVYTLITLAIIFIHKFSNQVLFNK